jgi:hypothetical protein
MYEEKKDSTQLSFGKFFEEVSICGTLPINKKCIKFNFICFQKQVIKNATISSQYSVQFLQLNCPEGVNLHKPAS